DRVATYAERYKMSTLFVQKINQYGGKAQVLRLPDAGLKGNTHIPFADMNNVAVADLLSKFLAENGLDKRQIFRSLGRGSSEVISSRDRRSAATPNTRATTAAAIII